MDRCRLCKNRDGNQHLEVREMLHGTREVFRYLRCSRCLALQIEEIPEDLSRFYPSDYYSYQVQRRSPLRDWLKRQAARQVVTGDSWLGALLVRVFEAPELLTRVARSGVGFDARILEVGSGAGKNLLDLRHMGFTNLTGVDPFIPESLSHPEGVRIHKCEARGMVGEYDLILLNDVFEHLPDPVQMLRDCRALLSDEGVLLLRTPIADCAAWDEYGVDWVQLDAPRHLHIHTRQSIEHLCAPVGLEVGDMLWDSTAFQFWGSEQYRRDIPIRDARSYAEDRDASPFSRADIRRFTRHAAELNRAGRGDAACFYLHKCDPLPVSQPVEEQGIPASRAVVAPACR